jgi:phosphoglycolate phosphatase
MYKIRGVLFDKDGTLFDFNATWGNWTQRLIESETAGDAARRDELAGILGYDLRAGAFLPGSIVIAETVETLARHVLPFTSNSDLGALIDRMSLLSETAPQVEATPLRPFAGELKSMGLKVGLATNDSETAARAHLAKAGVLEDFDFVAGYDSGHGAKPAPGPLLAFGRSVGLAPEHCAMIGDSLHDLHAGKAAGFTTVGVLTGPARREALEPHADVVLNSIAELPAWIAGQA